MKKSVSNPNRDKRVVETDFCNGKDYDAMWGWVEYQGQRPVQCHPSVTARHRCPQSAAVNWTLVLHGVGPDHQLDLGLP